MTDDDTTQDDDVQDGDGDSDGDSHAGATAAGSQGGQSGQGADGGGQGGQGASTSRHDGRRKPQFSEEQNRWIGAMRARDEDKRRAVEAERDAASEKVTTLSSQTETLQRELRQSRAENAVITAATKAGAAHPELIFRAVRDDLTFGDDGKPKDVEAIITRYKSDYPELFGARASSGADGGKGGGDSSKDGPTDWNALIRREAAEVRGRNVQAGVEREGRVAS